jgi:hypothetical protein
MTGHWEKVPSGDDYYYWSEVKPGVREPLAAIHLDQNDGTYMPRMIKGFRGEELQDKFTSLEEARKFVEVLLGLDNRR